MFKKFDFKLALKISGAVIFGLLALSLIISLGGFAFRTAFNIFPKYSVDSMTMSHYSDYDGGYSMESMKKGSIPLMTPQLSPRNIVIPGRDNYIVGNDSEDFEITEYSARIKTGRLDKVCGAIEKLKVKDCVIFESSNKNDNYCDYKFKVEKDKTDEILQVIKDLKPEDLNTNISSIKRQIKDFTSEEEILAKRLVQIEEILEDAQKAYDNVTKLATNSKDVEALAKIINDKIILIEKLTTERLNTKNNLDKLSRAKAEQLDKLDYTMFAVSVFKYAIIDFEVIKDSWERELKNFVHEFNGLLQGITIKLLSFATKLIQTVIYLIIALFVAKYGWRFVKFVWEK